MQSLINEYQKQDYTVVTLRYLMLKFSHNSKHIKTHIHAVTLSLFEKEKRISSSKCSDRLSS